MSAPVDVEQPPVSQDARLAALVTELERADAERHGVWSVFGSLLGAALVTGGAFLAVNDKVDNAKSETVQELIWLALALIPLLLLAFAVELFAHHVTTSYYTRVVERRVISILDVEADRLPLPSLESANTTFGGNRRGLWEVKTIHLTAYIAMSAVIIGAATAAAIRISNPALQSAALVAVVLMSGVLSRLAYRATVDGPQLWKHVEGQMKEELAGDFPKVREERVNQRRLISYLILPRPNELFVKGIALHFGAALAGLWFARGKSDLSEAFWGAALSFTCFEFLMYQARYMWNDKNGVDEDRRSPARRSRRRSPVEPDDSDIRKNSIAVTICMRVATAFVLAWVLGGPSKVTLFLLLVSVWPLAAIYEYLRNVRRDPVLSGLTLKFTAVDKAIYAIVGVSYALRASFGFYVGSAGTSSVALVVILACAFYFSGLVNVLIAWTLEATNYIGVRQGGALCRRDTVVVGGIPPANVLSGELASKWHLLPLARLAGIVQEDRLVRLPALPSDALLYREARVLKSNCSLLLPTNALFLVACGFAACAGWIGRNGTDGATLSAWLPLVALGGLAYACAVVRWMTRVLTVTVGMYGALIVWLWHLSNGFELAFVLFPLVAVAATYVTTRLMNYDQTIGLVDEVLDLPERMLNFAGRVARDLFA